MTEENKEEDDFKWYPIDIDFGYPKKENGKRK